MPTEIVDFVNSGGCIGISLFLSRGRFTFFHVNYLVL